MSELTFQLKTNEKTKEIKIATDLQDWKIFRKTMKNFQNNINEYLTSLVNEEGTAGDKDVILEEVESSDDEEKSPKRVLESSNEHIKSIKKSKA